MKKYFKLILLLFVVFILFLGLRMHENINDVNIIISVKNYGDIHLNLNNTETPETIENFVSLVNNKFYDGLTIHRVVDGFMIQGGDPNHNGTGGSIKKIKGEFKKNGVANNLSHLRGVISMARGSDNNSASSQFFIMQSDNTSLDGNYASFGRVTKGINVVDKICKNLSQFGDENGIISLDKQPIIEYIKIEK